MPESRPHILIAGGGISGLSAALELQDRGATVTLAEAGNRFGGPLYTEQIDDYQVDTGPDSFLSSKPDGIALIERLGLQDRMINTRPDGGGTFILRKGRLVPLPEGITLLVPTQFRAVATTPLLTPLGKLRLLMDYVLPKKTSGPEESVGDFVKRRMGRQAFEQLAEPLLSGIYAGDAAKLSLQSTFPRLLDVEQQYGGIIKGAIAQRKAAKQRATSPTAPRYSPFVSLEGGLGELIARLVDELEPSDIRCNRALTSIAPDGNGYQVTLSDGTVLTVDGVILATPAPASADLVEHLIPPLATTLREIPYVSSATVSMAFRQSDVEGKQGGRGFVIPRVEGRKLTAVTWSSNKFAGRIPDDIALLRGFVGRAGQEETAFLAEDELIALVRSELATITGITAEPVMAKSFRWHRALPQYNIGHKDRLDRIERTLAGHPRLVVTGSAYRGVGIPDCIGNARREAAALLERINQIASP